ncbi:MAG: hypothetical protein GY913_16925 [Proteobacteria bacterium]|nr:hypothetical protein [Pseudomonadota bacterium]MCP4918588.1 hypothetical protein [Pseudomonadota bacterium]
MQAVHFLRAALKLAGRPDRLDDTETPWLRRGTMEALLDAPWTGNTRELRAVCEQLAVRHHADARCGFPGVTRPRTEPKPVRDVTTPAESLSVEEALRASAYRLPPAAEQLGWSRNKLRREMVGLGLPRAGDLDAAAIQVALDVHPTVGAAAMALRVSERGLRLRMRELDLV